MEPKVTINARIVVVGASDTGIAFLEAFVFCPHLRFNNLTLISPFGLPGGHNDDAIRFLATSHGYSQRDHAQLSLRTWVNVVTEKMTAIDRVAKHIQVTGGHIISYDHLILCTGQQYQVPCPTGTDVSKDTSPSSVLGKQRCRYTGHVPFNMFTLNSQLDCTQAYDWLKKNLVQQGNAVVYGDTLDIYTCVETLLHLGFKGSQIHLVHQIKAGSQSCFQNLEIDQLLRTVLENKEIHVYHNCILAQLNDGEHPEPLTSVCFTTDGLSLRLECMVFFNFSCKGVDYDAFKAINDACLVFDGRLVIDSTFQTNDCTIHAAGPLTKFARRYHAGQWSHSNFNSKEVGRGLAARLLPLFDPVFEPLERLEPDEDRLIPVYKEPKIKGGSLPGGYNYLHVTKPSISSNRAVGREITTGCTETGTYFQLQFSQHEMVESITCLSSKPLSVSNYLCLYGKHQLLLNRLYERFDDGLVQDFYSYFRERWCMAIFHDRFADFEQEVRRIMESAKVQLGTDTVPISRLAEMATDGMLEINEDPSVYLNKMFGESEDLATLKMSLLDYLQFNRYHLTMYAQPRKL